MKYTKFKRYVKLMNWYPPFIGAGIRLDKVNESATRFDVSMKLRWYNRNLYGTHFGGSLYAMCDPWFVFIAGLYLGDEYILWDKSAAINYLKPGKGKVSAVFEISNEELDHIKSEVDGTGKMTYTFRTYVTGPDNEKVALVEKEIYIKTKTKRSI